MQDDSNQNRQVARNSDFFIILQAFVKVRVRVFKNMQFFALHGPITSKNPLFQGFLVGMLKFYPGDY